MGYTCVNDREQIRIGSVGRALPGCELKVSADGELLVKSGSNMLGYYLDPETTKATFTDGYIRTGDLAAIDSEGFVTITGRP